jgi:3-keto-5-aminohexanoate cleavage enzyme
MDKLIITVTCDSTMAYPSNPYNPTPKGYDEVAKEYLRSIDAGASICHLHGPYTIDEQIQADGTKLSDLDIPGWVKLSKSITDKSNAIIQYGIANGRFPQRVELVHTHKPDMISTCFNAHDECFDYEPGCVPVELYGLHDRVELEKYCKLSQETGVTLECECFHYGGVWNAERFAARGMMKKPIWITFFLGWRGGCFTPPTLKAMQYNHDHLPDGFLLGGHVRVGMEDNPFLSPGQYARSNAELVEKIVRVSRELGRDVASPTEARAIIWP